jgi:probable F420-dependent oxidoreductase
MRIAHEETPMLDKQLPELGFYTLPGHALTPHNIFHEIRKADEIGLGSVWIAERPNTKDIGVMSGIATALTQRMGIASGLMTNLPLRHPLVTAGYASTMMAITNNRFALGIGRGIDLVADSTGTPRLTFKLLNDYVDILRRLWRGETVNYDGPIGRIPKLSLGLKLEVPPPILMGTGGRKTAYWAGGVCDGLVLTTPWTTNAVREHVALARQGARDAGRDPKDLRIWAILPTACEVPEDVFLQTIIRRINTYVIYPHMFDVVCEANGWDKSVTVEARRVLKEIDGAPKAGAIGDEYTTRELSALRRMEGVYPQSWIRDSCAVGNVSQCVQAIQERFEAGVDGILFHATSPDNLPRLLHAWRQVRPAEFDQKSLNPGL